MAEFRDILQAKHDRDWTRLNELSLSRAFKHFSDADKESFAIFTAFRSAKALNLQGKAATPENVLAANRKRNKALRADLDSLGVGYSKLLGQWNECADATIPYGECPEDQKVLSKEETFFVNGISLSDTARLLKKYDQDAGVYKGPETDGKVWLVFKDGTHDAIGTKFTPNAIASVYSKLKGNRTFVFEYVAQSYQEALIEQTFAKNHGGLGLNALTSQLRQIIDT